MNVWLMMGWVMTQPTIISLDYCADQYVLALADHDQILALSPDATADFNAMAEEARGFDQIRRTGEDVLALSPDMVVRSFGGDQREMRLLERAGIAVHQLAYVDDFEGIRVEINRLGERLGQPDMAGDLIAQMDETLLQAGQSVSPRDVLYVTPGGVTSGEGTMIDAIIEAAGFENSAALQGQSGWLELPLESLVMEPPDLVMTGFFSTLATQTDRWSSAHHPVMQDLVSQAQRADIPAPLISCSNWFAADAALMLSQSFLREEGQTQ